MLLLFPSSVLRLIHKEEMSYLDKYHMAVEMRRMNITDPNKIVFFDAKKKSVVAPKSCLSLDKDFSKEFKNIGSFRCKFKKCFITVHS